MYHCAGEAAHAQGAAAQLLRGPLIAASFAADGQHLLLVTAAGWLLLHAPLWEVRGE